jgi:hypothetical protein
VSYWQMTSSLGYLRSHIATLDHNVLITIRLGFVFIYINQSIASENKIKYNFFMDIQILRGKLIELYLPRVGHGFMSNSN